MNIQITDVAPRDGLQSEALTLPCATRAELVDRLVEAGATRLEVASFVDPRIVPQMQGAEDVSSLIGPAPGVLLIGVILNRRGYDRLRGTRLNAVNVVVPCTDQFAYHNQRTDVPSAVSMARDVISEARRDGRHVVVTLAVALGCPYEGRVDEQKVLRIAEACSEADDLVIADTIGVAIPTQTAGLVQKLGALRQSVGVHLHNTTNMAIHNALSALEAGATIFDASVGGIGGCPFAPGAEGNVATEDLTRLFNDKGIATSFDLPKLMNVGDWLKTTLGRPHRSRGGSPEDVTNVPESAAEKEGKHTVRLARQ